MTDGLDQAIANAALNLLTAALNLVAPPIPVYDGKVPDGAAPPYVLVYTTVDRPDADPGNAADGRSRVFVARWICHCVGGGSTAVAARAVAQQVRTALLDVRPSIAGLNPGLIRLEQSQPPTRDEQTGSLVLDAVEVYRLHATV